MVTALYALAGIEGKDDYRPLDEIRPKPCDRWRCRKEVDDV